MQDKEDIDNDEDLEKARKRFKVGNDASDAFFTGMAGGIFGHRRNQPGVRRRGGSVRGD